MVAGVAVSDASYSATASRFCLVELLLHISGEIDGGRVVPFGPEQDSRMDAMETTPFLDREHLCFPMEPPISQTALRQRALRQRRRRLSHLARKELLRVPPRPLQVIPR